MAIYLEEVQWRARPSGLLDGTKLGADLPINLSAFSAEEVTVAVKNLKRDKAVGPDEIPAEYCAWFAVVHGFVQ